MEKIKCGALNLITSLTLMCEAVKERSPTVIEEKRYMSSIKN
jgi:hypothetical protein